MSNRKELERARRRADEANESLAAVSALPRRKGSVVQWSNGVVWTRVGDDDWRPDSSPLMRYSSAHVASEIGPVVPGGKS